MAVWCYISQRLNASLRSNPWLLPAHGCLVLHLIEEEADEANDTVSQLSEPSSIATTQSEDEFKSGFGSHSHRIQRRRGSEDFVRLSRISKSHAVFVTWFQCFSIISNPSRLGGGGVEGTWLWNWKESICYQVPKALTFVLYHSCSKYKLLIADISARIFRLIQVSNWQVG